MSELTSPPPELEELAKEVGDFICYWGFKKIHGRLWTHLYLSKNPLDAGQMMSLLKVSKALISLSLNDLLQHEVILENGKSDRGTQTYVANPDVVDVILNVLRQREKRMLIKAQSALRQVSALPLDRQEHHGLEPERIAALQKMIHQAQNALDSILELATVELSDWEEMNGKPSPR